MDTIINKVANSGLVVLNLEDYYPANQIEIIDLAQFLEQGLLLREKSFRETLKSKTWDHLNGKYVGIHCSTDAIVPTWAFMLLSLTVTPHAKKVMMGDAALVEHVLFQDAVQQIIAQDFKDAKVIIKGCSNLPVPITAYVTLANHLFPFVQSLMYGEPCSTVPLYKR